MLLSESILAIRVSRRAVAAAIINGESLALCDGFHLNSRRDRAERSSQRYVEKLITRMSVKGAMIYAPNTDEGATSAVLRTVQTTLVRAGLPLRLISKEELLQAFGYPSVRHWTELRLIAGRFWPELDSIRTQVKPFVIDAAAVGLYAESLLGLIGRTP